ncbi:MAG: hypothetical protein D6834_00175, partial [Aquificota bacterium]
KNKVIAEGKDPKQLKAKDIKNIFSNQNWFFLNEDIVKKKILDRYPNIKKIEVKKLFLGEINLYIWERKPFAILHHNKKTIVIDNEGVRLKGNFNKKNLPHIYIYDKNIKLNKNTVQSILSLNKKIKKYIIPKKIIFKGDTITFKTINDKIIVFNIQNVNSQLKKMKKFMKNVNFAEFKYLDFSFDSMVIARR